MNKTDQAYWDNRYLQDNTPWDIGYAAPPLLEYFDQVNDKEKDILIPGCGNGYEAVQLLDQGFVNTEVIDISPEAIENLKSRLIPEYHEQLIVGDYFNLKKKYDIVVEQTFFCALHPSERENYVKKTHELLKDDGKLMGVMFNIPLNTEHPPYGGHEDEYKKLFQPYFDIEIMETAHNSIKPRLGNELFILMKKKKG